VTSVAAPYAASSRVGDTPSRRGSQPQNLACCSTLYPELIVSGHRNEPVYGYEVSDKLSALAEEYRTDNLPITFRNLSLSEIQSS
jgi:hypothetical protein